MRYRNFDIKITSTGEGSYFVTAKSEKDGTADGELFATSISKDGWKRGSDGVGKEHPKNDFGAQLYQLLFQDAVGSLFKKAYVAGRKRKTPKVRLRFCVEPREISAIPWEFLYDQERKCFLSASAETPLIRYVACKEPIKKLKIELPIKILVVVPEASQLRQGRRLSMLRTFRELSREVPIEFITLEGLATQAAIRRQLARDTYHVIHFVASGGCDREGDYVLLDAEDGLPDQVAVEPIERLIEDFQSLKLAVFDCHAAGSDSDPRTLAGVAPELVGAGLPAVIAVQFPMADVSAGVFAAEFYRQLCAGDEPGRVEVAVAHARSRVLERYGDSPDFAAPVLFMSATEGVIFYFDQKKPSTFSPAGLANLVKLIRPFARRTYSRVTRLDLLSDIRATHCRNIALLGTRAEETEEKTRERLEKQIKDEKARVIELEDKLWPWGKTLLIAFVFSLFVGFASEFKVLNKPLDIDNRLTHMVMDFASRRSPIEINRDRVAIVLVDKPLPGEGEELSAERNRIADLLPILRTGRAKVVAIDIGFRNVRKEADANLWKKIIEVETVETGKPALKVISSGSLLNEDGSLQVPAPEPLASVLKDKHGLVGVDAESVSKSNDIVRRAVIGKVRGRLDDTQTEVPLIPSLALLAVMKSMDGETPQAFYVLDDGEIRVGGKEPKDGDLRIPAMSPLYDGNDRVLSYISYVTMGSVTEVSHQFSLVRDRKDDISFLEQCFKDRIVLVTVEDDHNEDTFHVPFGETRRGTHILANVVSNILSDQHQVRPPWLYRYLLIVLMVGLGLLLQARFARVLRQNLSFTLPYLKDAVQIPLILCLITVLYFVVVESFYERRLLLDITYPPLALVLTYGTLGLARKTVMSKWS